MIRSPGWIGDGARHGGAAAHLAPLLPRVQRSKWRDTAGRQGTRVEDQINCGAMDMIFDNSSGRHWAVPALVCSAVYPRNMIVWLNISQILAANIVGCETGWGFVGGPVKVLIPDDTTPAQGQFTLFAVHRGLDGAFPGSCVHHRPRAGRSRADVV